MIKMDKSQIALILAISIIFIGLITMPFSFGKTDSEKIDDLDVKVKYITDLASVPDLELYGTEYQIGDTGDIWLQLLDSTAQPISNSTCFVTVWFPNNTLLFNETVMSYLDKGIHYKDFTVPDQEGVYKQTALCSVPELIANYSLTNFTTYSYDDLESGDADSGTGWVTSWGFDDNGYASVTPQGTPIGNYHIRILGYDGKAFRVGYPTTSGSANITFWYKMESLEIGDLYHLEVFDESLTDWVIIKTWDLNDITSIYTYFNAEIPSCESGILIQFRAVAGTNDNAYFDNISIISNEFLGYYEDNATEYQYVFGSGEIHVSDYANEIQNYIVALSPKELRSNHDYCLDNTTLVKVLTYENLIGDDVFTTQRNETIQCEYGCFKYFNTSESQGYCSPTPIEKYVPLVAIIVFVFLVLVVAFAVKF